MAVADARATLAVMTQAEALDYLPVAHAIALRLEAAGRGADVIADALGIEVETVVPLLRVARAKLDRILDEGCRPALGRPENR